MGNDRPLWLGFVCWVLIITGTHGLYSTMKVVGTKSFQDSMSGFPYPASVAVAIIFATLVVMIVSGICMYERQGWARWFYIFTMPFFFTQRFLDITAPPPQLLAPGDDALSMQVHLQAAPAQTKEEILLTLYVLLYLCSIWILFTFRARRYFHPPMYVDE